MQSICVTIVIKEIYDLVVSEAAPTSDRFSNTIKLKC